MSDYGAILDRARREFPPPGMPIQGVLRRRDRKRRNQRVGTAVFALAIAVAGLAFAAKTIGHGSLRPARPPLPTSWSRVAADPAVFGPHFEMHAVTAWGQGLVAVGGADLDRRIGHRILSGAAAIWNSSDGRLWRRIPTGEIGYGWVMDVAAGPTGLVAVGYDLHDTTTPGPPTRINAVVWTSGDGIAWKRLPTDGAVFDRAVMNAVTPFGSGFAAVGISVTYSRSGSEVDHPVAWVSSDGTKWSRAAFPSGSSGALRDVTAYRGRLVAVGTVPGTPPSAALMWTSKDGRAWTRIADLSAPLGSSISGVAAGTNGWIAVGSISDSTRRRATRRAAVWSSPDGVRWRRLPSVGPIFFDPAPVPKGHVRLVSMDTVAAGPAGYVAIGHDTVCGTGPACGLGPVMVWSSRDGRSWVRRAGGQPFVGGAVVDVRGLTSWSSRFVAVGYDSEGVAFPGPEQAAAWISNP